MSCFKLCRTPLIHSVCCVFFWAIQASVLPSFGQEKGDIFPEWRYYDNPDKWFYKYLADDALGLLHQRDSVLAGLHSVQDWKDRQQHVRQTFDRILGAFPEKTPLNAVVTDVMEREDVTVDKVYFESLPGYVVTGAFFRPSGASSKLPVLIYCSGHSDQGFRSDVYQHVILNYVKKGFAVFAFDPIGQGERKQYQQDAVHKGLGPTQEHSYPGSLSFLMGRSPAYYFIWDGIRAIDYVCSRPEVDTTRIGITGRSGGGTQTAYIAAFDSRIKAAAPECYITSYEKLLLTGGPQDVEQNFAKGISSGLNIADLMVLFAPKPLRMLTTTRDIFNIQGARDAFQDAKRIYRALGAETHLSMAEDDAAHASTRANREAGYQFFQQYLDNPGDPTDEEVTIFKEEDLYATPGGQLYQTIKSHTLHSLAQLQLRQTLEKRKDITDRNDLLTRVYQTTSFHQPTLSESPIFTGRFDQGYPVEKYLIKTASGYYMPVVWMNARKGNSKHPLVLLLDDQGKAHSLEPGGYADSLALAGYEVVVPDLSGYGELGSGYFNQGDAIIDKTPLNLWYAGILVDRSLLGIRMAEISLLVDWLKEEKKPLMGMASGTLTTDLLHTALVRNKDLQSIVLIDPLESVQSLVEEDNYLPRYLLSTAEGMVEQYDLPQLVQFVAADKPLLRINPRNGAGKVMPNSATDTGKIFSTINQWLKLRSF